MSKEVVFLLCGNKSSNLGFGNGIYKHLLALSKFLRKTRKVSTKELSSLSEIFTPSGRFNAAVLSSRKIETTC